MTPGPCFCIGVVYDVCGGPLHGWGTLTCVTLTGQRGLVRGPSGGGFASAAVPGRQAVSLLLVLYLPDPSS